MPLFFFSRAGGDNPPTMTAYVDATKSLPVAYAILRELRRGGAGEPRDMAMRGFADIAMSDVIEGTAARQPMFWPTCFT